MEVKPLGLLDYFFANYFTIGALIPTAFHLFLSYLFLSIRNKSKPTFHLGIAYIYLAVFNFGYFIAGGFYHPLASFHRWITVGVILLHITHVNMFMLNIKTGLRPLYGRIFLIAQYAVSFAVTAAFFIISYSSSITFLVSAHQFDFDSDAISRIVGLLIISYLGIFIVCTGWKVRTIKTRERYLVLLMGLSYLIASIVPSVANIMSRDGIIDRGTFQVLWDLFSLAGLYILVILYLNYTQDRAPVMAKIVSIILLTVLLILQGFSYYSFQDNEKAYDTIHQTYAELALTSKNYYNEISYVIAYSDEDHSLAWKYCGDDSIFSYDFLKCKNEYLNALMYERIKAIGDDGFRETISALLEKRHDAFEGYAGAILDRVKSIPDTDKNKSAALLAFLDRLQGTLYYHTNRIKTLPDSNFRSSLKEYLAKTAPSFGPFRRAMEDYLHTHGDEGFRLRNGVLSFLAPIGSPKQRHYRVAESGSDHFISYLHVDSLNNMVYDVGFSYASYRSYLHPSAMKFINALWVILFVIILGFNLFLRGVVIVPLKRLIGGLREISMGNMDVTIPVKVGDEIGFVTSNFNQMADTIRRTKGSLDEYTNTLEQKVLERTRELAHSEERYRNILESIQDGYYEVDLKGDIKFVNSAMLAIMGYREEELLNRNYSGFTDETNARNIFEIFNNVFNSGVPSSAFDYPIIQKDGARRITEAVASVITDHAGRKTGFRGIVRDITERRRAEEALRQSEEKFRSILENIKEGYYEVDIKGTFRFINHAMCSIYERPAEEIVGHNFREFMNEAMAESVYTLFNRAYRQEDGWDRLVYYEILRKDGSSRELEVSIDLWRSESGAIIGFRGMCRDITERKKVEEDLRVSEEKYRTLLDIGVIGYFEVDLQGTFTFCNRSFIDFLGYPEEEIIGMNFRQVTDEKDGPQIMAQFSDVFMGKIGVAIIIMKPRRKDGTVVFGENYVSTRKNASGRIIGFRCVGIDITERTKAEAALFESEEKYRNFVESATDGIFRNDISGNFLYVNPAGQKLLGYDGEELLKLNYRDVVVSEYKKTVMDHYRAQFRERIDETYIEFPIVHKNGEVRWLGQNTKLKQIADNVYEFHGISRDVTERKKAEEARLELEEQKTRFFANISHEIRTPLTLMLSPIESVLQGDYGKKINRAFFDNLYRNGLRLLKLVNNILDFSKIEAGRMRMKLREVDMVFFVRNYISAVHSAAESKGLTIQFSAEKNRIPAFIDVEKMDKVIMNLFSNSLKFTENGGAIAVTVRDDDVNVFIEFSDTGEGIPVRSIESIFDRFSQADTSATRRHEGTGIGLALARELAEMHGGTIAVESRYVEDFPDDHGSVFTVTVRKGREHFDGIEAVEFVAEDELGESVTDHRFYGMREMHDLSPGAGEQPPVSAVNEKKRGNETQPPSAISNKPSVLIVDDNADMRNFLTYLLQKQYTVHSAENGKAGFDAVQELSPDIVITDVMMPVMDGHELTRRLKSDSVHRHIPVIMLTAKAEMTQKLEGLEHGADDFLTKPFNSKELLARIRTLLKTREYEREISRRNFEIEQEMEVARLLQLRLLPEHITELSGYMSHALYIPMDKVGGDFYDYSLREQFIDLFIADVSGHGLPGAFLAMMTKMSLEGVTERQLTNRTLYLVNDVICRSTVHSNYVTAFLCRIDTRSNIMKYSNAGHLPPLIYRRVTGEFLELKSKGKPLGWFKTLAIEEKEIQLLSGDRLILFTDGITECINPLMDMYGDDRFREFIIANRDVSPSEFCGNLMTNLREFSQSEKFDDDLTLIVFDVL